VILRCRENVFGPFKQPAGLFLLVALGAFRQVGGFEELSLQRYYFTVRAKIQSQRALFVLKLLGLNKQISARLTAISAKGVPCTDRRQLASEVHRDVAPWANRIIHTHAFTFA
jgi:hypothetical protein